MRKKFNLDLADTRTIFMMAHGEYGVGKTFFLSDMLAYEKQFGEVRYLDAPGEQGWKVAKGFGLGEVGESVETYQDMLDFASDCVKQKIHAIGADTLRPMHNAILTSVVGAPRLPDAKLSGDRARWEWGQASFEMELFLGKLRHAADIVLCTCPSAVMQNEVTGEKRVTPDLMGRLSYAAVGAFDFAGFVEAKLIAPGKFRRTISFQPRADTLTKQRLPKHINEAIELPQGPGGWKVVKDKIEAAFA